jgi:hypothetical protein
MYNSSQSWRPTGSIHCVSIVPTITIYALQKRCAPTKHIYGFVICQPLTVKTEITLIFYLKTFWMLDDQVFYTCYYRNSWLYKYYGFFWRLSYYSLICVMLWRRNNAGPIPTFMQESLLNLLSRPRSLFSGICVKLSLSFRFTSSHCRLAAIVEIEYSVRHNIGCPKIFCQNSVQFNVTVVWWFFY